MTLFPPYLLTAMGCQSSAPQAFVIKTSLLKTNHPSLNSIIEEAEHSLQELARICNPLEVAVDRFFAIFDRGVDEGFKSCFLALIVTLFANTKEGDFLLTAESPGFRVKTQELSEHLLLEYESWRQLAIELEFTIADLTENLLALMDCAMTSHKLNQALIYLIKTEELRVVDIRKVVLVLEQNEVVIREAAELLHLNVRRAKKYTTEADLVTQWLRKEEGWKLMSRVAGDVRETGLRTASEVLINKLRDVDLLARSCPMQ